VQADGGQGALRRPGHLRGSMHTEHAGELDRRSDRKLFREATTRLRIARA